jgi:predicted acyltransferase
MAEQQKEMSFLGHLEELRWHLVRSASAIFIIGLLLFVFQILNKNPFYWSSATLRQTHFLGLGVCRSLAFAGVS